MGHRADVVERVLALGHRRLDESLQLLTENAAWLPGPGRPVVRGHDEIRAFVAAELQRLGSAVPDAVPAMLFERESVVLVLGQIRIPHKERARPYTEMQPIGWVYEFDGDLIGRVSAFGSWEKARAAAGVPAGTPPTRLLKGGLWHPAVAVRRPPLRRWRLAPAPGF
jgi:hypothetical protein